MWSLLTAAGGTFCLDRFNGSGGTDGCDEDAVVWLLLSLGEAMFCLGCFADLGVPDGCDGCLREFWGDMLVELAVCGNENLWSVLRLLSVINAFGLQISI